MSYVDGFVVPVPRAKLEAYRAMSQLAGKIWREYGALHFRECVADDVKSGQWTSFPQSVKPEEDEVVVFSWIEWPSKAARDAGMAKFMADPRMTQNTEPMPFDGKRMFWGGFDPILDERG